MKTAIITALFFLISLQAGIAQAGNKKLVSPYPKPGIDTHVSDIFTCPKPPKSIRHLEFQSIYTDRSEGVSIVDPEALIAYREAVEPVRLYERGLDDIVAHYIRTPTQRPVIGQCGIDWLYRWAEGEALLGTVNAQGVAVRKWALASLSSLYMQIKDEPALPLGEKKIIEAWLNLVAQTVRKDYSTASERDTRHNNHMFWAAWAVMATAVATDDRELFNWAIGKYKEAVDQIDDDGTLPLEMTRMGKAFNYHVFAAGPLVMMAETAKVNGTNLYKYRGKKLHSLIERIVTELNTDQLYISEKTGKKQDLSGTIAPGMMAWMEPYAARFPDKAFTPWLKKLRPMNQPRLGGNLTLLYEEQ